MTEVTAQTRSSTTNHVRTGLPWRMWKHRTEYLLISPFFIIFGIFHAGPLLWSLWLSFHRWQGIGPMRWFGTGNYERLLGNRRVIEALQNTSVFVITLLPLIVILSLVIATILNSKSVAGRNIFRTLYFLPYITSVVIAAIVFELLLQPNFGWVNGVLESFGIDRIGWLTEPVPARLSIIMMVIWSVAGYNTLIMLGGLQGIPSVLYDAASVDGATSLQQFFHVTLPSMRGTILFVALTSTIALLNLFTQPWLLFSSNQGRGPDGSTATLNTIQYTTAFTSNRYGEASALGFIIALLIFVFAIIQLRISRQFD